MFQLAKEKAESKASSPYLQAKGGVASLRLNLMKRNCGSSSENVVFAKKPKLLTAVRIICLFPIILK